MKQLLLIGCMLAMFKNNLLPQSPHWPLPPNKLQFSNMAINLMPGASATTNAYYAANCGYDANGNIFFYVVDGKIYNQAGTLAGSLTGVVHNSKNIIIVPDPADCNASLVFHIWGDLITSASCSYVSYLQCTRIINTGSGLTIQQNHPVSPSNYDMSMCNAVTGMCISPPRANGSRFLYIAADERIYKYLVSNTGITLMNNVITGSGQMPTDLELSPSGDKLAYANAAGGNAYSIKWIYMDANGDFVLPVYQLDASPAAYPAYGLEFINNNQALVAAGNGTQGGVYLATLSSPTTSTLVVNQPAYVKSQLEKGLDGKVYGASANGLMAVHTGTFAANYITLPMGSNQVFSFPGNYYSLPRQLDNENYSAVFSCTRPCASTITITGTYTVPLTEASAWIKSNGNTSIPAGYTVKLDANNAANNGFIELQPGFQTQAGAIFIARALDGCGGAIPMRTAGPGNIAAAAPPITATPTPAAPITLHPNPTGGLVTVRHPAGLALLQVYDAAGNLKLAVKANAAGKTDVNISHLPAGIYYVRAAGQPPQKLVKQ